MKKRLATCAAAFAAFAASAQFLEYLHPEETKPREKTTRAAGDLV